MNFEKIPENILEKLLKQYLEEFLKNSSNKKIAEFSESIIGAICGHIYEDVPEGMPEETALISFWNKDYNKKKLEIFSKEFL